MVTDSMFWLWALAALGCGRMSAAGTQPKPFDIRGFKGCYWYGIDYYRLALPWLAEHGMNFLMFCYSSFPASGEFWRSDYTSAEKEQFKDLAAKARKLGVNLCLSFNPGIYSKPPIEYSSERDYQIALDKVKKIHALGIHWISLCLDDIDTAMGPADEKKFGTIQNAHVYLVNRLWSDMKSLTPRPKLVFCPSAYCTSHARQYPDYINTIGEKVDRNVMLFWTGPEVCSTSITAQDARDIAKILRRKPFIWDNYPVNDAFAFGPYMSPLKNRSKDLAGECSGFMANDMKQWYMSTIALDTVAQYLRDPGNYHPDKAIEKVIQGYPADQQRAIRLLVEVYGKCFWGDADFPPWPRPASADEASRMLPKYRALRKELSGIQALAPLYEDVRPMLEQNIEHLENMIKRVEFPLKAVGSQFAGGAGQIFGYHWYDHTANIVYCKPTGRDEMSVEFILERVPSNGATLRIEARGDGAPHQIHIQVELNNLKLVDGPSPFRYDDFDTRTFEVPAANLKVGTNLLVVRNMETEGQLGNRPWLMVSEAEIIPHDNTR